MFQKPPIIIKGETFTGTKSEQPLQRVDTATKLGGRVADLVKSLNALEPEERRPSFRHSQAGSWRRPSESKGSRALTTPHCLAQTSWAPSVYHTNDGGPPDRRQQLIPSTPFPSPSPARIRTPERPNPFRRRDSSGSEVVLSPAPRRDSISHKAFERMRAMSPPMIPEDSMLFSPAPYRLHDDNIATYITRRLTEQWCPSPPSVSSIIHTPHTSTASRAPPSTPYPAGHVETPFVLDILRNIDHILSDHTATLKSVLSQSEQLLRQKERHCQPISIGHNAEPLLISSPTMSVRLPHTRSSTASGQYHPSYTASLDDPPLTLRGCTSSIPALVHLIDETAASFRLGLSEVDLRDPPSKKPSLTRRPKYRSSIGRDAETVNICALTPTPPLPRPRSSNRGSIAISPPRIRVEVANQPLQDYLPAHPSPSTSLPLIEIPPSPSTQPFITLIYPESSSSRLRQSEGLETLSIASRHSSPPLIEYDRDTALADRASSNRSSLVDLSAFAEQTLWKPESTTSQRQQSGVLVQPSPPHRTSMSLPPNVQVVGPDNFFTQFASFRTDEIAGRSEPGSATISQISPRSPLTPPSRGQPSPPPSPPKSMTSRISTTRQSKSVRGSKGTLKTTRPPMSFLGKPPGPVIAPMMMAHETQSRVKNARGFWTKDRGTQARSERPWFQKRSGGVGSETSAGRGTSDG
jgi:hypothetical protein